MTDGFDDDDFDDDDDFFVEPARERRSERRREGAIEGPIVEVTAERLVAGGVTLSRQADGRIVLVDAALPGERCEVALEIRRGADHGRLVSVLEPSPDRIDPRCAHVLEGCGGCDLATLGHDAQVAAKLDMVADSLRRLGRWKEPEVVAGPALDPWAFRTTMRFAVQHARLGLRMAESNEVVTLDHCEVAHPLLDDLVKVGRFPGAKEVTVRVGAATDERLVLVDPTVGDIDVPSDVRVVGSDELAAGRRAWYHDEVAGRRWRISAESFFQTRPDGAAALIEVVRSMSDDLLGAAEGTLVDAYCGVGLFAGALLDGREGWRGVAAERSRSSVADARINLADLDVRVIGTSIERLRAPRADLVVADPSRAGLGRRAVGVLAGLGAERIVLVSCDPGSAGRDTALLTAAGYRPVRSVVVDLFAHTRHVEVVTRFDRVAGGA